MIKISANHHAICEKCEKPFDNANAVVVTELNDVNGTLIDIVLCHVQVHKIPGFKGNDWADRMSVYHAACWPGIRDNGIRCTTVEDIKALLADTMEKPDWDSVYRFCHFSLGCRI